MNNLRRARAVGVLLLALAALGGCAGMGKCNDPACAHDAELTASVKSAIFADSSMRAPNSITVQTINGVVYLYGTVATGLQREQAESYARGVKGVGEVVNSITVENVGR